jgi:hypothetical protein
MNELKEQMKVVYEIMGDPELIESIANLSWNLYTALVAKGFSPEQAMLIVGRYSMPTK